MGEESVLAYTHGQISTYKILVQNVDPYLYVLTQYSIGGLDRTYEAFESRYGPSYFFQGTIFLVCTVQ